jgi:hypothetical protein
MFAYHTREKVSRNWAAPREPANRSHTEPRSTDWDATFVTSSEKFNHGVYDFLQGCVLVRSKAHSAHNLMFILCADPGDHPVQVAEFAESGGSDMPFERPGRSVLLSVAALTIATLMLAGCSDVSKIVSIIEPKTVTGPAFIVGTDAPVASVTSFAVQVMSITASDGNGHSVSLLSGSPTVDFARFNGLQTLLDMNDVAVGSYSNVTITLGGATIGYLDTTNPEPAIKTENATLTTSTINITLPNPLVVAQPGAPVGLHLDFDLRKSIAVDANGQITGNVTPTFAVNAVSNTAKGAYIDEFDAAVVSVNTGSQSFVIQGPHGRQLTVNVNGQTEWDGNETLNDLTSNTIVQISGTLDGADATIDADEVAILSQDGFYAAGQITYVNPAASAAASFDLYVRGLLPTTTGITLGQLATVDLSGNENFSIYWMHGPLAQFLFNPSGLLPGQHVSVGGPASGAANAQAVTVKRVVLRNWGFNGTVVPGSVNAGKDSFQMTINGFAGILVPQTVTVYVTNETEFRDGLTALSDVAASTNIRVVGLLLKDPTTGETVLVGHYVDALN